MDHYTMLYKYGKRMCVFFLEPFYFFLSIGGFFDKTIIPLALVGYEMIIANSYPMHTHGIIVKYSLLMNHCSNKKKMKQLISP